MRNLLKYFKPNPKPEPVLKLAGKVMSVLKTEPKKGAFKPTHKKVMATLLDRSADEAITRVLPSFDEDKKHLINFHKKGVFWSQCLRIK